MYQVTTVKASSGSSVDKNLYPTWNCNMTPLFEDQTNMVPLRKQYVSFRVGVSNWSVLSGKMCVFIASRWILHTRVDFWKLFDKEIASFPIQLYQFQIEGGSYMDFRSLSFWQGLDLFYSRSLALKKSSVLHFLKKLVYLYEKSLSWTWRIKVSSAKLSSVMLMSGLPNCLEGFDLLAWHLALCVLASSNKLSLIVDSENSWEDQLLSAKMA